MVVSKFRGRILVVVFITLSSSQLSLRNTNKVGRSYEQLNGIWKFTVLNSKNYLGHSENQTLNLTNPKRESHN